MRDVQEIIDDISDSGLVMDVLLGLCMVRFDEAAPVFRAVLERAAAGETLDEADENRLFYGVHVLGAGRDPQSCAPLLRLLRRPSDDLELLLGDALTETLPRIVAGVFDGNDEALFAAATDPGIDEYARYSLLGAIAFLTWEGRIERERTVRLLERFDDERLAEDLSPVWDSWQDCIALLGLRSLAPRVEHAWEDGRMFEHRPDQAEFWKVLAAAEADPDDVGRFTEFGLGYIEDIADELAWAHPGETEPEELRSPLPWATQPVVNPFRHVGRNDPCPCGSGKKAKKCCLTG